MRDALYTNLNMFIGFIPARGGSKRLPGKNLKTVGGKSLVRRAVECASQSKIHYLIWSSDDVDIRSELSMAAMEKRIQYYGLNRPPHLATDSATSVDVVLDAFAKYAPEVFIVLLQPTSPLRDSGDVNDAIAIMRRDDPPAVVTTFNGKPNGAVYIIRVRTLRKHKTFTPPGTVFVEMPEVRSIDIDSQEDLDRAEQALMAPINWDG